MEMVALCVLVYILLIPGMYAIQCFIDRGLGIDKDRCDHGMGCDCKNEWGLALVWPIIMAFCILAFFVAVFWAPFVLCKGGRQSIKDRVWE